MRRGSPRWRRVVAGFAETLAATDPRRVVLILGAGADTALSGRPLWNELLTGMAKGLAPEGSTALGALAGQWPAEAADALLRSAGPSLFERGLRRALAADPVRPPTAGAATALNELVRRGSRVILNFNYTSDVSDLLRAQSWDGQPPQVRVIERSQLAAWNTDDLLHPPEDTVHVIHVHGLFDPGSRLSMEVVLTKRSYTRLALTDPHYSDLLLRIFRDFVVLSVGMSWSDVPLRDAAARAYRESPAARPVHLAILPASSDGRYDDWLERAFLSAYSIRPVVYDHTGGAHTDAYATLLRISAGPVPPAGRHVRSLPQIADYLDSLGDFESSQQVRWLTRRWERVAWATIEASTVARTLRQWMPLARIEQHLRHFFWFHLPPRVRDVWRRRVWIALARSKDRITAAKGGSLGSLLDDGTRWPLLPNDRILLDFAIGAYEVFGQPTTHLASRWQQRVLESTADRQAPAEIRLQLATQLWGPTRPTLPHLRSLARASSWEGMEAKIAQDQLQRLVLQDHRRVRRSGSRSAAVLDHGEDAIAMARLAGSVRREVGATVLQSFFLPPTEAESQLMATYERLTREGGEPESSAVWAVYVGLLAVYADTHRSTDTPAAQEWIESRCGKLLRGDASRIANHVGHWRLFHPVAAGLARDVARLAGVAQAVADGI